MVRTTKKSMARVSARWFFRNVGQDCPFSPAGCGLALAQPVIAEAAALPADDGFGADEDEGGPPGLPQPGQEAPQEPVRGLEARARGAACGHGQLMAQGEDLELQVQARAGEGAEEGQE